MSSEANGTAELGRSWKWNEREVMQAGSAAKAKVVRQLRSTRGNNWLLSRTLIKHDSKTRLGE